MRLNIILSLTGTVIDTDGKTDESNNTIYVWHIQMNPYPNFTANTFLSVG